MNANAKAPRKRVILETPVPVAGAVVVTARYADGRWETRVAGGRLDAWKLAAPTAVQALGNHEGAVRLVREAARG